MAASGQMDDTAAQTENNGIRTDPSLIYAIVLATLPAAKDDTEVRKLAVMVNPMRGDLFSMLGERFHTLEWSPWKTTKIHGDHALHIGVPALNNAGRREQPRSGGKSGRGEANSKDAKPDHGTAGGHIRTPWKGGPCYRWEKKGHMGAACLAWTPTCFCLLLTR